MENILDILRKHDYQPAEVGEVPLEEGPAEVEAYYQVAATKDDDLQMDLAVDKEKNLIVVNNLDCPRDRLDESLKDLNRVSLSLDSETVLVKSDQGKFPLWKNQGFSKHYKIDLTGVNGELETARIDEVLEEAAERISVQLGEEIVLFEVASELPYIYSIQMAQDSVDNPNDSDFHCDLHCHELTGAVFLDRLWIPEDKRYQGIGTETVDSIIDAFAEIKANYLYLKATASSESFWDRRSDFDPVYRLNLRWARRMRLQMKRDPNWDKVYVRGERLPHPLEYYGNHPGEDWDFYLAQELLMVSENS